MTSDRSWTGARINSLAALPAGLLGRFGGWVMARTNRPQQLEVLALAEVAAGESVLEVGHGPGVLLRALTTQTKAARIVGVDPSAEMHAAAARRNATAIAAGRVQLAAGTAADTGQPDAVCDVVLSVNTVAIWPDLAAGMAELDRVTCPSGRVLLSWHGGTHPSRLSRPLALPEHQLGRIEAELRGAFGTAERVRTRHCEVFVAKRAR